MGQKASFEVYEPKEKQPGQIDHNILLRCLANVWLLLQTFEHLLRVIYYYCDWYEGYEKYFTARLEVHSAHVQIARSVCLTDERLDAAIEAKKRSYSEDFDDHITKSDDRKRLDVAGLTDEK